jgi:hypothetical protein
MARQAGQRQSAPDVRGTMFGRAVHQQVLSGSVVPQLKSAAQFKQVFILTMKQVNDL